MIANDYNRNIYIYIYILIYWILYIEYICILIDHSYVPITWLWSILLLHGQ
jgi:hypothetical protein